MLRGETATTLLTLPLKGPMKDRFVTIILALVDLAAARERRGRSLPNALEILEPLGSAQYVVITYKNYK